MTCAPDDLCVLAAFPPAEVGTWAWLTWLPHTAATTAGLHNGPADRLLATSAEELERQLRAVVTPRLRMLEERTWDGAHQVFARVVIVVDRFDPLTELGRAGTLTQTLARAAQVGVTILTVCDPGALPPTETTALITVGAGEGSLRTLGAPSAPRVFTPVALDAVQAERLARRLSPKRLLADSIRAGRVGSGRLADLLEGVLPDAGLLGAAQGRAQPAAAGAWPEQPSSALLRVPFAVTADGSPLVLDLKESADGGYGPHGLVVGAVGSGKSELLRTLVSGLVAIHSPDDVELAFADFKGGLTFSLLHQVPHCSGMITNLADDLSLVDRMKAALTGELERRQQQLRSAGGDVQKISQYRELRRLHPQLPPMPYLVVVVDEFGELLEARPDVLDVLLSVGRTGRSLGVHLVLASQRLETGRTRGLRQLPRLSHLPAHLHPRGQPRRVVLPGGCRPAGVARARLPPDRRGARPIRRGDGLEQPRPLRCCTPCQAVRGRCRRLRRRPGRAGSRRERPRERRTTPTSRSSFTRHGARGKGGAARRCGCHHCPARASSVPSASPTRGSTAPGHPPQRGCRWRSAW